MNEKRRALLRTVPFLIIGVLVFILYLVLFVDIPKMLVVVQNANMLIYISAALTLVLSTFFFSLTWHYLLRPLTIRITLKKAFLYVWIGVFADLLIPAESVSGEIVKAYIMSKEPDVNPGKVIASLVSQRILGTITTTATLLFCFLGLLAVDYSISGLLLQILILMVIVCAVALNFLLLVWIKEKWIERLVIAVMRLVEKITGGRFKLEQIQTKIIDGLRAFYEALRTYGSNPTSLVPAFFSNIMSWLLSIAVVFLVFVSIGYLNPNLPILLLKITVVYTLFVAIKSIPLGVPAEVGLPDILMATMFGLFGIPIDISAAATVLTRILTVWLSFFIGFAAVQWLGVKGLLESGFFAKRKTICES